MSWQESNRVDLRKEFVQQATKEGTNISDLCRRYNISRKTGYKWLDRYRYGGNKLLIDQSTRPHYSPNELPKSLVERIISVREEHPRWGARKIHAILNSSGVEKLPAISTIHKVLEKHGYVNQGNKSVSHLQRFEHEAPNHLWQMDFKGHFEYEKGRCHPLTILDDYSRFSIKLQACTHEDAKTVKPILIDTFRCYGLPERINVDNGNPWGSPLEQAKYTTLSIWLMRLGITISYSRPNHPQTNGKIERFHRTLKLEVLSNNYFRNISSIQRSFDRWRDVYNLERPHEGIGMKVPSIRYHPSYRHYPEKLAPVCYSEDYNVHKVDSRGRICTQGRQLFVGTPFAKELVGLRQTNAGGVEVYYCHQKLGQVALSSIPKNTIINLYSKRVADL
jgi:transposase InsO family protein